MRIRADNYFDTIRGILDSFAPEKSLDSLYVTWTIPAQSIVNALEVLEIDMERIPVGAVQTVSPVVARV